MIEFRDVTFSYGAEPVLQGISFQIPDGEARVILGQSGSGKSTILKLLLGLYPPFSGAVLIDGQDIGKMKERELREVRKKIGMVFQDGALFDSMTVGENVGFYLIEHSDLEIDQIEKRVREMLGYVGLDEGIIDKLPDELSGGMQRRVAIGRALLATDPKIMLYDEPTTGLDPESTSKALALMKTLAERKKISTVVVTHQIVDALEIADDFIFIDDGQVVFDGKLDDFRDCPDPRVLEFLNPFRKGIAELQRKKFA